MSVKHDRFLPPSAARGMKNTCLTQVQLSFGSGHDQNFYRPGQKKIMFGGVLCRECIDTCSMHNTRTTVQGQQQITAKMNIAFKT